LTGWDIEPGEHLTALRSNFKGAVLKIVEKISLQKARIEDFPILASMMVSENRDPRNQCMHSSLDEEADGLLQEMMKWAAIGEIVFVLAKYDERIVGVLGSEYDQELGRGWLWGPFAQIEDRTHLARKLFDGLLSALPKAIRRLDAFLNLENRWGYEFYMTQGFREDVKAHVYIANREDWQGGMTQASIPINHELKASFCALHPMIFPNAYYSAQRVLDQIDGNHQVFVQTDGNQVLGYVFASVSSDADEGEIEFLGVQPGSRHKGLGRKLLKSALYWLFVESKVTHVTLTVNDNNVNARSLYEEVGFRLKYSGVGLQWEVPR
jgi:ribosomal protein S18 acetylase RimI-like enzyme